jgi:hypothetical protein
MVQETENTVEMRAPPLEHRQEPRYLLSIAIEVCGIDRVGRPYRVVTKTTEVSEWGCSFFLPFDLDKDAIVCLSVLSQQPCGLPENPSVIFQIMNARKNMGGWMLGASKAQPERLWNLDCVKAPRIG